MPDHPTIYAGLLEHHVESKIIASLREHLKAEFGAYGMRLLPSIEEQMRKAYVAGVTDGFAQGVAAESDRRDEGRAEPGGQDAS